LFRIIALIAILTLAYSPILQADEAVEGKYKLKVYGLVRLDAHYDNAEVQKGDWMLWANPSTDPRSEQEVFTMTARHSQLGISGVGPMIGDNYQVKSKIELDFAGGFSASSSAALSPQLRLRFAWLSISNPNHEFLFGQDWALISAPFPNMANYMAGAGVGNFWARMAQMRYTYTNKPFSAAIALARPVSANNASAGDDLDPIGDGERAGLPFTFGRVWYDFSAVQLSVAGHYGQELVRDIQGNDHTMDSWSAIGTFKVPAGPVVLETKWFIGSNVNTFSGGIFQGVMIDSTTVTNVETIGGWVSLTYNWNDRWSNAGGYSFDDPDDTLLPDGKRGKNSIAWLNVNYKPAKDLRFALEGNLLTTDYVNKASGEAVRVLLLTTYSF